jgi:glutamine amidotransferase
MIMDNSESTTFRVKVLDLHLGNTASVVNMLRKCGAWVEVASQPEMLTGAEKIVLSGVGAFDAGMQSLQEGGWVDPLTELVVAGRTQVLGICLGMQLMCQSSEEGHLPGLGWIEAEVKRLELPAGSHLKIPHMGWNTVEIAKANPLISAEEGEQRFYFVHSYYAVCRHAEDVLGTACHGSVFTAAFSHANIYGVQFHPEKSHRFGMALMKRFVELSC